MQDSASVIPRRRPPHAAIALSVVAGAVLAAGIYATSRELLELAPDPVASIGPVPEFRFADANGGTVGRADLLGAPWVAAFFFSRCSGLCPTTTTEIAKLARETADLPRARFASITLDPEYDTPKVLAEFAARVGADPARWLFLTPADADQARNFATQGLHIAAGDGDHGAGDEEIVHSPRLVLVDARGIERAAYDTEDPTAMLQLRRDLRRLADAAR